MKPRSGSCTPKSPRLVKMRKPAGRQRFQSLPVACLACLLMCASLTSCTSKGGAGDGGHSPTAKKFPKHLCDSGISTAPLKRIYPKGASGPIQMAPDNRSTGNINHFIDKEENSGAWICSIQFNGEGTESTLFMATIMAVTEENTTLLEEVIRGAGYHPHSLTLRTIHGVNGPRRSALEFPCQVDENTKITIFVRLFHPIDRDAADARRERVVRISSGYIQDLARYVIDELHLCTDPSTFPSGEFKSKPIPEATSAQPSADG